MKALQFNPSNAMIKIFKAFVLLGLATSHVYSAALDATIKAFESKPGYVQPIATFMGSIYNSAWFSSASVEKELGYTFGMPLIFAFLQRDDQFYSRSESSNCAEAEAQGIPCPYSDPQTKKVPTIFGPKTQVTFEKVLVDQQNNSFTTIRESAEDGFLANFVVMPFAQLETGFRHDYFEYKLRGLWLPLSGLLSDGNKLNLWDLGAGVIHDLGHYVKGGSPVDFSLGFNYTYWAFAFTPGKTYAGTLDVHGHVGRLFALVGKKFSRIELLAHLGYGFSKMASGGSLLHIEDNEVIRPNIEVDGRNGLEIGLQFTAHLGWDFLTGYTYGSQSVTTLNFLQYKSKEKQ